MIAWLKSRIKTFDYIQFSSIIHLDKRQSGSGWFYLNRRYSEVLPIRVGDNEHLHECGNQSASSIEAGIVYVGQDHNTMCEWTD